MALQKTWTKVIDGFESQASQKNAYCKISGLNGNKNSMVIEVSIFNKKNGNGIDTKYYTFAPSVEENSLNDTAQAYYYLKTLPDFSDAVDC